MSNTGKIAEQLACDHLQSHKLKLIAKNYHCRRGEIDLIMQEQSTLVFIEVRYRKSARFGSALESVTPKKQQKIIFTAEHFIASHKHSYQQYRFDVVAITPSEQLGPEITWVKNAFQLN